MTFADALNILADLDFYAQHNLTRPMFREAGDGKLSVSFRGPTPSHNTMYQFESMAQLNAFISGRASAQNEAKAAQAAQE